MKAHLHIAALIIAMLTLTACDVHQFPEQHIQPEPPQPEQPKVTVPLRLQYQPDLYIWEHKYDPLLAKVEEIDPTLSIFPDYPGTSAKYTNIAPSGQVQVHIKAFPTSAPTRCVAEQTLTYDIDGTYDTSLNLELPAYATYNIIVWSQLLKHPDSPPFYDPTSFSQVHIIPDNYEGNTDYRDAFRGKATIDVTTTINGDNTIYMKRPMGKFELITTDLSEFLDRETETRRLPTRATVQDYRVTISFPGYYPSSYSAMNDYLENASTGIAFQTTMTVTGTSEASLGFEYVLLNDTPNGGVQTRIDVYRLDGTRVAGSATFTIPMRRDHHTTLRGAFLSMEGSGGVGIDPGFNGDHNITWH